jgi:hypothetical protein
MYHDPSHGWRANSWLRVPLGNVRASGVSISPHSYMDDDYAYLEGDRDAIPYLSACGYWFGPPMPGHKNTIHIVNRHSSHDSFIRKLRTYKEATE